MTTATETRKAGPGLYCWQQMNRTYGGKPIHKGQVIALRGLPLDEKLKSLGYFEKVKKDTPLDQCLRCGAEFIGPEYLARHEEACPEAEIEIPGLEVN